MKVHVHGKPAWAFSELQLAWLSKSLTEMTEGGIVEGQGRMRWGRSGSEEQPPFTNISAPHTSFATPTCLGLGLLQNNTKVLASLLPSNNSSSYTLKLQNLQVIKKNALYFN